MKRLAFRLAVALTMFSLSSAVVTVINSGPRSAVEPVCTFTSSPSMPAPPPVPVSVSKIGEVPAPIDEESSVGIQFVDEKHGWLGIDNKLWRTRDGGRSWELIAQIPKDEDLPHLPVGPFHFVNAETGWLVKDGKLLRTDNGGGTWYELPTPLKGKPRTEENRSEGIDDFSFTPDGTHGWLVLEEFRPLMETEVCCDPHSTYSDEKKRVLKSTVYYTRDAARTWTVQPMEDSWYGVYAVQAIDATHAIAYGMGGIFYLNDGRWRKSRSIGPENAGANCLWIGYGMPSPSPGTVKLVDSKLGWLTNSNGYLGKTVDGGKTWFDVSSALGENESGMQSGFNIKIHFSDPFSGWGLSDGRQLRITFDGGVSWQTVTDHPSIFGHFLVRRAARLGSIG